METQIIIFEGNKEQGIFSKAKRFYKEGTSDQEKYNSIKEARIKLGEKYGFSGLKMFQVEQKMEDNDVYPDNKYIEISEEHIQKDDYFLEKIEADILVITNKYPKVALSHRMADCPVLIAEERKIGVCAIAHCNMYHIDRGLPKEIIKVLINKYNSKEENIYLYIGSYIHKDSYIYDTYPNKAKNNKIWKNAIDKEIDGYHIDLVKAIKNQLSEYKLGEIKVSEIDTAKDQRYASHSAEYRGNKEKKGQNIVGFYYKDA